MCARGLRGQRCSERRTSLHRPTVWDQGKGCKGTWEVSAKGKEVHRGAMDAFIRASHGAIDAWRRANCSRAYGKRGAGQAM